VELEHDPVMVGELLGVDGREHAWRPIVGQLRVQGRGTGRDRYRRRRSRDGLRYIGLSCCAATRQQQ
jgi:hypothetical protein